MKLKSLSGLVIIPAWRCSLVGSTLLRCSFRWAAACRGSLGSSTQSTTTRVRSAWSSLQTGQQTHIHIRLTRIQYINLSFNSFSKITNQQKTTKTCKSIDSSSRFMYEKKTITHRRYYYNGVVFASITRGTTDSLLQNSLFSICIK